MLEWLKNPYVSGFFCTVFVFIEMFGAKKWFTSWTVKIKNETVRTGLNLVLGVITSFALAAADLYLYSEFLGARFIWNFVFSASAGATLIYLALEKVFGNAKVTALGKVFSNFISHSDLFDGKLTSEGMVSVANKLLDVTRDLDKKEAAKEEKAINQAVELLKGFVVDGKITEEEKAEANKIIAQHSEQLKGNPTYERYQQLLNQK